MRNGVRSSVLGVLPLFLLAAPAAAQWPPEGVALCTAPGTQTQPVAVPDGAGGAFVAWVDSRNLATTGRDIYAQRVTGAGQIAPGWPANGIPLCTALKDQRFLSLVPDGEGGAIAAWMDFRNSTDGLTNIALYAERMLGDGSLAPGWAVDGLPVSSIPVHQPSVPTPYQIAADGQGGVLLTWSGYGAGPNDYAQRIGAAGAVAPGWPADGVVVAQGDIYPKICADGYGGCFIGWTDYATIRSYMQRLGATGATASGWPASGQGVASFCCGAFQTAGVATDASGGAFVVSLGDEFCAFAVAGRVDTTLGLPWGGDGRVINTADPSGCALINDSYRVLGDGLGNVFLSWVESQDAFVPSAFNLGLEKLDAAGAPAPGWPANPIFVGDTTGIQGSLETALDGQGGILLAWIDGRGPLRKTYAQRITSSGAVADGWATGGVPVCASDSAQGLTAIASDGAGGAIFALLDRRNNATTGIDLYAQRLLADGTIPVAAVAPEDWRALAMTVGPNPSTGALHVRFTLAREGPASLELLDAGGRRLAVRSLGHLPAGPHDIAWDLGGSTGAGIYWVRLVRSGRSVTRRVVLFR